MHHFFTIEKRQKSSIAALILFILGSNSKFRKILDCARPPSSLSWQQHNQFEVSRALLNALINLNPMVVFSNGLVKNSCRNWVQHSGQHPFLSCQSKLEELHQSGASICLLKALFELILMVHISKSMDKNWQQKSIKHPKGAKNPYLWCTTPTAPIQMLFTAPERS